MFNPPNPVCVRQTSEQTPVSNAMTQLGHGVMPTGTAGGADVYLPTTCSLTTCSLQAHITAFHLSKACRL